MRDGPRLARELGQHLALAQGELEEPLHLRLGHPRSSNGRAVELRLAHVGRGRRVGRAELTGKVDRLDVGELGTDAAGGRGSYRGRGRGRAGVDTLRRGRPYRRRRQRHGQSSARYPRISGSTSAARVGAAGSGRGVWGGVGLAGGAAVLVLESGNARQTPDRARSSAWEPLEDPAKAPVLPYAPYACQTRNGPESPCPTNRLGSLLSHSSSAGQRPPPVPPRRSLPRARLAPSP